MYRIIYLLSIKDGQLNVEVHPHSAFDQDAHYALSLISQKRDRIPETLFLKELEKTVRNLVEVSDHYGKFGENLEVNFEFSHDVVETICFYKWADEFYFKKYLVWKGLSLLLFLGYFIYLVIWLINHYT